MAALQRVRRECGRLREALPRSPLLSLEERANGRVLHAEIEGPGGSPFEAVRFGLELEVGDRYPFEPPAIRFASPRRIFHPNICPRTGGICLDILNDPTLWSPVLGLESLLLSVVSLLSEPRTEHGPRPLGLNSKALELFRHDPAAFATHAAAVAKGNSMPVPVISEATDLPVLAVPLPATPPHAAEAAEAGVDADQGSEGSEAATEHCKHAAATVVEVPKPTDQSGACWVAALILFLGIVLAQQVANG